MFLIRNMRVVAIAPGRGIFWRCFHLIVVHNINGALVQVVRLPMVVQKLLLMVMVMAIELSICDGPPSVVHVGVQVTLLIHGEAIKVGFHVC